MVAPFMDGANASDGDAMAEHTMALKKRIMECNLLKKEKSVEAIR